MDYKTEKEKDDFLKLQSIYSPLENIVLNSQYVVLLFHDSANGNDLSPGFDINILNSKRMLIKSIRLVPYTESEMDVFFNRTQTDHYTIPGLSRIPNTVLDTFGTSAAIVIEINGTTQNIFPSLPGVGYTLDMFVDNIYFNYKSTIQGLNVRVLGEVFTDLDAGAVAQPLIKVFIECYLY